MNESNQLAILTTMSQSEFKQFKKALRVLCNSGVSVFQATEILLCALETRREANRNRVIRRVG